MLAACVLLGMMILPTIIGVTESAIRSVPESYYEGSLALGATKERSIFFVMLPAAKSGILAAVVLGTSVLSLADVAFPICPFFRHLCSPFRFGNTNNYHRRERKSSKFLKISDIFQGVPFQEKSLFFVYCGAVFAPLNPPEVALTALLEIVM